MKPDIKLEALTTATSCYCCFAKAWWRLVIGHRNEDGTGGNAHAISLCTDCREKVSYATELPI